MKEFVKIILDNFFGMALYWRSHWSSGVHLFELSLNRKNYWDYRGRFFACLLLLEPQKLVMNKILMSLMDLAARFIKFGG